MAVFNFPFPGGNKKFSLEDFRGLKDALSFDNLAKIRLEDVRFFITENQTGLFSVACVVLTFFISAALIQGEIRKMRDLDQEIAALHEKTEPVDAYLASLKSSKEFLKSVPSAVAGDKFISELTSLAKKRGIEISSFTPPTVHETLLYKKITVSVVSSVPDFQSALLFIYDLERAPYSLKVEEWKVRGLSSGGDLMMGLSRDKGVALQMSLKIATIDMAAKNDENIN